MVYSLIYLVNGKTTWASEGKQNQTEQILNFKKNYTASEMCQDLAAPLTSILESLYQMEYEEDPDYDKLIKMFVDLLLETDFAPQVANYDWVKDPKFLTPGQKEVEPSQSELISTESLEITGDIIEEKIDENAMQVASYNI